MVRLHLLLGTLSLSFGKMTRQQHIVYGLHSNIPWCCIEFFITDWPRLFTTTSAYSRDYKASYIRCPDCLTNNRLQEIHFCHLGCDEFHSEHKLGKFHETLVNKYDIPKTW